MKVFSNPLARAGAVMVIVFAVVVAGDLLLGREGISRLDLMLVGDALVAVAIAALYLIHSARVQEHEKQLERRLRIVAEMNHHIRNALQPLLYLSSLMEEPKQSAIVRDSVKRIEWALHEILPDDPEDTTFPRKPYSAPQPGANGSTAPRTASARIDKIHAPE